MNEAKQKQLERIRKLYKYPSNFFKELKLKNPYVSWGQYQVNKSYNEDYNILLDEKEKTGSIESNEIDFAVPFVEVQYKNAVMLLKAKSKEDAKKKFKTLKEQNKINNYITEDNIKKLDFQILRKFIKKA